MHFSDPLPVGRLSRAACEGDGRPSEWIIQNFDFSPGHGAPAEPERFHHRLLGGKTRGQPLTARMRAPCPLGFRSCKQAADEMLAPSRDRLLNA